MKKIALVGCGRISNRHIEAIKQNKGLEVSLVCDVNKEKGEHLAKQLYVPFEENYNNISNVDFVSILTPSGLHPRHVIEIAQNTNIPFIICEKPLSLTVRETYEMLKVINKTKKTLLPIYQNRYNPLVKFIKTLISKNHLGNIHQFVCNIFWNRNKDYFKNSWHGTRDLDGGVLYTQASHYVDMVHYLFGEVIEHKGIGGNLRSLEVYDSVSAICSFKSGVVGSINATVSTYGKNYLTEFIIIAEKGTIRLSGTNLNEISYWNVKGLQKPEIDFKIDHIYGKGHDKMYEYILNERWDMFPSNEDIISGIKFMEMLSY
ncbi:MAG: Gfo/Idh/MocA family oxidoreductase [bacterium]|nr:Gfo/Idh/MocA family oxidoreductase [bacterium]